jgi:lysophospholipase L1-like esterase
MIIIDFIIMIWLAIAGCASPAPVVIDPPTRLVTLGDSITHRGTWPATAATSANLVLVRNAGVDFNTTTQMLARVDTDVLAYGPDVVTILGGTNDRAHGVKASTAMANLGKIIDRLHEYNIRVVLITMPPNTGSVSAWNTAIKKLAASKGAAVADIFPALANSRGGWASGMTVDGVHPSAAGYARMSPIIAAALEAACA